ncbi:MAG: metallophosphoesterase [Candidatus Acidiferrales bacterium]
MTLRTSRLRAQHNKRAACALVLLAAVFAAAATNGAPQQTKRRLRGSVYDDANGNGQRDEGEKGIARVSVSDQASVVLTGEDGNYQLEVAAVASVIFVSVPDGWSAPTGFWRAVDRATLTGDPPVDFALRTRAKSTEFTFIHASDTHLSKESLPRIRRLREIVERERPAFVLITGDLVRDALRVSEAEARGYYEMFAAEIARFPMPVWTVPGNHEIFGIERQRSGVGKEHPLYGKQMYRHYLGPNYYSFTWGGVRFIGLDTADIADLWYYGHIDAAQMEWLKKDLAAVAPGAPVVTFNHIPLASATDGIYGYEDEEPAPTLIRVNGKMQYRHLVSNTEELLEVLRPFRLEIALGGHMHARESLAYPTASGVVRFHQASAVVGPAQLPGITVPSGVTLYRVRDGKIDDGTFILLDDPANASAPR